MTRTLVTILGRARRRDGGDGYEKATYRFPDGTTDKTAFFGLALARHLQPDEIVILGTTGSLWSVLVEDLAGESSDEEEARIQLIDAEESGNVEQSLLDRLAPLMGRAMHAVVRPTLIPNARDAGEQYAILKTVDDAVKQNGELDFDLTHGFRHLGMVGFLSSFMLERLRSLEIRGLWYGALDMTRDSVTPVLRLDGLMGVRRWVDALDRFDATGDYGVFGPLLVADGVQKNMATQLEEAAFLERTLNVRAAAQKISTFLHVLECPLNGASELFRHRLAKRLGWARKQRLSEKLRDLARLYLNRGDFVRAAMFGWEACVAHVCEDKKVSTVEYSQEREEAVAEFEKDVKDARARAYWLLKRVRNSLAHGTRPNQRDIQDALKNPKKLRSELEKALRGFFE